LFFPAAPSDRRKHVAPVLGEKVLMELDPLLSKLVLQINSSTYYM